jgi:lipoate-protein ligase B
MKQQRPGGRVFQDEKGYLKLKDELEIPQSKGTSKVMWSVDLPETEYRTALDIQHRLVIRRASGRLAQDVLLLLEHSPVFTLGRRGSRKHLLVDEAFLRLKGIPVVRAERGGEITYHGPGQLVGYPILDLLSLRLGVQDLQGALEEVMIRTLGDWQIGAHRSPESRGVWVEKGKVGSIGIAIRRGVSFHGFALNVNTSLEPFSWIHPCGLEGVQVTSMGQLLGRQISMEDVRSAVYHYTEEIFRVKVERTGSKGIGSLIGDEA